MFYQNLSLNKSVVMRHSSVCPECGNCGYSFPISKECFFLDANWPVTCPECKQKLQDIVVNPFVPEMATCKMCGTIFERHSDDGMYCTRRCSGKDGTKRKGWHTDKNP